jgi:DNA excision repair protein ERCC-1
VSPRQRGNPLLTCIRSMPWEYSDIPADYVVGLTTCVLFLRWESYSWLRTV